MTLSTVERSRRSSFASVYVLALAAAFVSLTLECDAQSAAPVVGATDTIRITRRFFGMRYVAGTLPQRPVIEPWIGLSLHRSFTDVMARHPAALEQARKASTGLTIGFVGSVGAIVGLVMTISAQLDQADALSAGGAGYSEEGTNKGLVIALVSTGVSLVGSTIARGHINRSIATFNGLQRGAAAGGGASQREPKEPSLVSAFVAPVARKGHGRTGVRLGLSFALR